MSDYTEAAPNVSKLVTLTQFKLDFPAPRPPAPAPSEPDDTGKAALYQAFRTEYNTNGGAVDLRRLARSQAVPIKWCRILMREVAAAKAAVYAVEPE